MPPRSTCYTGAAVSLPSDTLYISNTVTERTKCGSKQSPWKLEALPGQQINLTLLDFTEHPSVPVVSERCAVRYALVKEQGVRENSMCRGTKGNYLSTSSSLMLSVLPGGTHRRFFIKYQGECTTCTTCQYYLSTSSSLKLSVLPGGTHRRFFIKYQGKCTTCTTCQYYLSTSSSLRLSVLPGGTHRRFFIKYQGECTTCTTCQYYLSTSDSLNLSVLPGGTHRRFFIKYQGECTTYMYHLSVLPVYL